MAKSNYHGLILAGGRGTRFWPRSRKTKAKQVLNFLGERTLIQQTVDRLAPVISPDRIWVVTNDELRDEIIRQLPNVPKRQIIAEPAQRNTAPCIGLMAQVIHSIDEDAVMAVFPADHMISKPSRFVRLVKAALKVAEQGHIGVLGVQPRWPETGYGYIEFPKGTTAGTKEPVKVVRFREKPDLTTAKKFVKSGNFFWNAGMFFWRTSVLMESIRRHQPKTATLLASLPPFNSRRFTASLAEAFPRCENISIDYAVLEKADNVVGIASDDFGWNDVGSWNAVHELLPRDASGNALVSEALLEESTGNYVDAQGKLVALLGVKDLIVVDTPDALLIADRRRAQEVGKLVKMLESRQRHDLL